MPIEAISRITDAEQNAQARLTEAEAAAARLVEEAELAGRRKMADMQSDARRQARAMMDAAEARGREQEQVSLQETESLCEAIRQQAAARLDAAADLIVKRIAGV